MTGDPDDWVPGVLRRVCRVSAVSQGFRLLTRWKRQTLLLGWKRTPYTAELAIPMAPQEVEHES